MNTKRAKTKNTMLRKSKSKSTLPDQAQNTSATASPAARFGRRSFLKRLGSGSAVILPAGGLLASQTVSRAEGIRGLTRGDAAILRFLAAIEIIETDLWQQYNELALGNEAFQTALAVLDGDMPTYVNQNTRDEVSHQDFLNAYLASKGQKQVSLEPFRRLPSSQATGANQSAKRLTNLTDLTVDTSWYTRYRGTGNPDFGDNFPQIVNLVHVPGIPAANLPVNSDAVQLIANTAGFHFATVEEGGSSLYSSMLPKATSTEVIKIIASIGGTEIQHFEVWQDKAGNAPPVPMDTGTLFPALPLSPDQSPNGIDPADPIDTNQIMPRPCQFISPHLPLCSVIRPTSTREAGAKATVAFFTDMGLFQGQSPAFFDFLMALAEEADDAMRAFI